MGVLGDLGILGNAVRGQAGRSLLKGSSKMGSGTSGTGETIILKTGGSGGLTAFCHDSLIAL